MVLFFITYEEEEEEKTSISPFFNMTDKE